MRKLNRVDVASLPLDLAFKRVKGNGERKLVVFSDADCPFCAKLEKELKSVDNVTIYTFLFPIDTLHPDSARKSRDDLVLGGPREGVGHVLRQRRAAGQHGRLRQSGRQDRMSSARSCACRRRRR